jgi:hypothetical protein
MAFDVSGAKAAGYSDEEIAKHLASQSNFDYQSAVSSGYKPEEIVNYLASKQTQETEQPASTAPTGFDRRGQLREFSKALVRGFGEAFLSAGEGVAELADAATNKVGLENAIDSGDENALVDFARQGRETIANSAFGADPSYEDAWFTKFGGALGSLGAFATPVGVVRGLGFAGKGVKFLGGLSAAEAAAVAPIAVGGGASEQVQRIEAARQQGIDVSQGDEDNSILVGGAIGASELLPLPTILKRIPRNIPDAQKFLYRDIITNALVAGGQEAAQEAVAGILQDATEKGFYNENLEIGQTFWDDLTLGGAAGATFNLIVNAAGARRQKLSNEAQIDFEISLREQEDQQAAAFAAQVARDRSIAEIESVDPEAFATAADTAIRQKASQVQPPSRDEVESFARPSRLKGPQTPSGYGETYGYKIVSELGDYFPSTSKFKVVEGKRVEVPVTAPDGTPGVSTRQSFNVVDEQGRQYGTTLSDPQEANALAYTLNSEVLNKGIRTSIINTLETSGKPYDPDTAQSLFRYGYQTLNPDTTRFTSAAINSAAGTTTDQGYLENVSYKRILEGKKIEKDGNLVGYEVTLFGQPRFVKGLTKTQEMNRLRAEKGLPETQAFTMEEAREALGKGFDKITSVGVSDNLGYRATVINNKPVVVSEANEVLAKRPTTTREKAQAGYDDNGKSLLPENVPFNTVQEAQLFANRLNTRTAEKRMVPDEIFENKKTLKPDIENLLKTKNISSGLDSPEVQRMAKAFTGKESVDKMSRGEQKLFYSRLRNLPRFAEPTQLPVFEHRPYSKLNFVKASKYIQDRTAQGLTPEDSEIAQAAGLDAADPRLAEKLAGLKADLSKQQVKLTAEKDFAEAIKPLSEALQEEIKGIGLDDISLRLQKAVRDRAGAEIEGTFDPNLQEITLSVSKIDPDGSLTPEQRLNGLGGVMRHEVIHAVRNLDLWTDKEWNTLQRAATNLKRKGTDRTYLEIARESYADTNPVVQMEEAVAEMVRDHINNASSVAGQPRNLVNRVGNFFNKFANALRGTGFATYEDVIRRLETGSVGARERRIIRTLRATEELAARTGLSPEELIQTQVSLDGLRRVINEIEPEVPPEDLAAPPIAATSRDFPTQALRGAEVRESRGESLNRAGRFPYVQKRDGSVVVQGDLEQIRESLPPGVKGRPIEGGVAFTSTAAPRVLAALRGERLTYGRAGQVVRQLPMKDGKYVGAPEKYDTPAKIPALRRRLRNLALEGEYGKFWYEDSGRAILQYAGNDINEAKKFVALLSIYSPQAKVDANGTFALRAWAQYKAGQPISVKTAVQDNKANAAMSDIDAFWSGEKTGNFVNNLLRSIDPSLPQGATIDMWMMRAAEYASDAPTATQYAFMENETNRIARELGWEPQQVQAAIWVAMKARMENKSVKDLTERSSEQNGWIKFNYRDKNGKRTKQRVILDAQQHRDNWLKFANEHTPNSSDKFSAGFHFGDALSRHVGQVSFEARPGRSTNVLPGVHDAPYSQQLEFQQAVDRAFYDPETGTDLLASYLGLLTNSDIIVPGVWEGDVSPSNQRNVVIAPAKGEAGEVDAAQAKLLNVYASVKGLLARQEGVGWHKPYFATTVKGANSLDIDVGRPLAPEEARRLSDAIDSWMLENNKSKDWNQSFALISSPNGIRLVNFGAIENSELQKDIVSVAEKVLPDFDFRLFASQGDMPGNNWKENPNGEGYIQGIRAEGRSDVLDWAADVLAPRVDAVFRDFSERYGWGNPGKIVISPNAVATQVREDQPAQVIPPTPRTEEQLRTATVNAAQDIQRTALGSVPLYNLNASSDALFVAQQPELGLKLDPQDRIRYSRRNEPNYSPAVKKIIDKNTPDAPEETVGQTVIKTMQMSPFRDRIDRFRSAFINSRARHEYYQYNHPSLLQDDASTASYSAAVMADKSKALAGQAITSGMPVYENGIVKIVPFVHKGKTYRGLLDVMAPLYDTPYGNLEKLAQNYAIAKRGTRLNAEGKLTPVAPGELAEIQKEIKKFINPETGRSYVEDWYEAWQAYNANTIKFLKDTGILDEEGARIWLSQADYVPFYKQKEGKYQVNPKIFGGMTAIGDFKSVGNSEQGINVPLFEAIIKNLDTAIAMGMKNVAMQRTVRDMIKIDMGHMVQPGEKVEGRNSVTFKVDGKKYTAIIDDELMYQSMLPINDIGLDNILGNILTTPARVLRELIVRDPGYMVANMQRDTISASLTTGSNYIPIIDTVKGLSRGPKMLSDYGIIGGYDFRNDPKDIVKFVATEARSRGHEIPSTEGNVLERAAESKWMFPLKKLWDVTGKWSDASEASTRNAVYEDVLKRTGNEAEAVWQALNVINYGQRGNNQWVRLISAMVPFLNARIQGLDRLYLAATGKSGAMYKKDGVPERSKLKNFSNFAWRALLLSGTTYIYYMMISDEDEYKNATQESKDNYYLVPIKKADPVTGEPGFTFRLPIPFEVGVMFKVFPERILDAIYGETNKESLKDSFKRAASSTLGLNPVPQIARPLLEAATNYSFYTGRSIVPVYMENLDPRLQARFGTSQLAIELGSATGVSPLKIDHAMNGYFGTLGGYTLDAIDSVWRNNTPREFPEKYWFDYPVAKRFVVSTNQPGRLNQFYDLWKEVDGAYRSYNQLYDEGREDEVIAYEKLKGSLIDLRKDMNYLKKKVDAYRKEKDAVLKDETLSPEAKRIEIDQLDADIALELEVIPELMQYAYGSQEARE